MTLKLKFLFARGCCFFPRLGDDGGQAICRSLFKNNTLTHVHLGSNDLGEPTAAILSQVCKNIIKKSSVTALLD